MQVDLRQIRYFIAVAEDLHFGRAANRLGISQPPLSQQILALERSIGARLFNRSNRRVELTEAGRVFYDEGVAILSQLEAAVGLTERVHRGHAGELKTGFFGSAPFTPVFQQLVYAFRQQHPAINLVLREMTSYRQVDAILGREIDVGFVRPLQPCPDTLEIMEIAREDLVVAMRADHQLAGSDLPIDLRDLAEEPLVTYARSIGSGLYDKIVELCRNAGFTPNIALEANATPTMLGLVAAGVGISILPTSLQRLSFEGVHFRPLTDKDAHTAVWLARRRSGNSAPSRLLFQIAQSLIK